MHQLLKSSLILFLLTAGKTFAIPVINEHNSYYQITGTTHQQLRDEMKQSGPNENGEHYDANTTWQVKWSYTYQESAHLCQLTRVQVVEDITYLLPEWSAKARADSLLQQDWKRFQQQLREHEETHAQHGKQAATDIDVMLEHLAPATDCKTLEAIANSKAEQIVTWYHENDDAYDKATNHGVNDGAMLS
jgi:predicted secreted Zn-dependent protease